MITPQHLRAVSHADAPAAEPAPDMRTWWGRNAKATGSFVGGAIAALLVGTGGMTGLAHVAGIALTEDLKPIRADLGAVVTAQQTAADLAAKDKIELNKKLDAIAKDAKAARAAVQSRTKKKVEQPTETREP